jgi:hypothetical protein
MEFYFECTVIGRLPLEEKSLTLAHKVVYIQELLDHLVLYNYGGQFNTL